MNYICIRCRKEWVIGEPSDHPSGAMCEDCTIDYVRSKQKTAGYHDCYFRNEEECSKKECSYWSLCNKRYLSGQPTYETSLDKLTESKFG